MGARGIRVYAFGMPLPVRVQCPECDTWMLLMAPDVMKAVGNMGGPEGELGFLEQLKDDAAKTGDRLVVSDIASAYSCPECSEPGQLPSGLITE